MAKEKKGGRKARRERKNVPHAVAHIHATFNNTIVTFADPAGGTLCWSSGGRIGYKGSRKGTPYAAQLAAKSAAEQAQVGKDASVVDTGVTAVNTLFTETLPALNTRVREHGFPEILVPDALEMTAP